MLNVKKLLTKILIAIKAPILFKVNTRTITQNAGTKDYWTMPDTFNDITGYTKFAIAIGTSNGALCTLCTRLNSNRVEVQTFNYAGSQQSATLSCLYLWIKNDFMGGYSITGLLPTIERWWRYVRHQETAHENTKTDELQNSICFCNFSGSVQ